MGTNYYAISEKSTHSKPLHIGKSSVGWKFLFYKVEDYENYFTYKTIDTYEKWKELLQNENISIINEYDEIIDFDSFVKLVEIKQHCDNPDNFKYHRNIKGYRFSENEFC